VTNESIGSGKSDIDGRGEKSLRHGIHPRRVSPIALRRFNIRAREESCTSSGEAWDIESRGHLAHFRRGNFLGLDKSLIRGAQDQILEQLCVRGIDCLWIDLDGSDCAIAPGDDFDGSAAAACFNSAFCEIVLDLRYLLLHTRSLFHEFSESGHKLKNLRFK
jgi:hypothetical protein